MKAIRNFWKRQKFKEKVTYEGTKEETSSKTTNNKNFVKISTKKRVHSRRKTNQTTKNLLLEHEILEHNTFKDDLEKKNDK